MFSTGTVSCVCSKMGLISCRSRFTYFGNKDKLTNYQVQWLECCLGSWMSSCKNASKFKINKYILSLQAFIRRKILLIYFCLRLSWNKSVGSLLLCLLVGQHWSIVSEKGTGVFSMGFIRRITDTVRLI